MTPFWGLFEKGSTNGETLLPIAFWKVAASQFPSEIIAAWPFVKAPRMFVLVRTSLFVQPRLRNETHLFICETIFGEVHGILPV